MTTDRTTGNSSGPEAGRLDSWKEIAAHLGRSTRTVQRWEKEEGLPVHRRDSAEDDDKANQKQVFAYKSEIDDWWRRFAGESAAANPAQPEPSQAQHSQLKHRLFIAALVVVIVGTVIWQIERGESEAAAPFRPVLEKLREFVGSDQFSISPDGVHVAILRADNRGTTGVRAIWLETLDDSAAPKRLGGHVRGGLDWSADGDLLQFQDGVGDRTHCVQKLYRLSSASIEMVPPEPWPCYQPPASAMPRTGKYFSQRELEDAHRAVDLVDPATGESVTLFKNWMGERNGFQLSPDGRSVVYRWRRDDNWDIYMRNLPDGDEIRITNHPGRDHSPIWSPDGREIFFFSARAGGRDDLWRVPVSPEGATARPTLLVTLGAYDLCCPFVSPEGNLIYVNHLPRTQLAVIPVHPASGAAMGPELPDFSPDSYFREWRDSGKTLHYDKPGVGLVDRDMASGHEQSITVEQRTFPSERGQVIFSKQGDPILFVGFAKDGVRGFYSFNEDYTELRLIREFPHPPQPPVALSPDGTEVLLGHRAGATPETPGKPYAVLAFRIADGELREVARGSWHTFARWSPDGSQIAYTDGPCLMLIPREGGESRKVTCGPEAQGRSLRRNIFTRGYLAWSPDGSKIAWTINDLNREALDIRVVDVATGAYHVLWTGDGGYGTEPRHLEWSPSGEHLSFTKRFQERREVWRLSNIWPRARVRLSD